MSAPARLDGRRAVVTGAARGIGRACAERLHSLGAKVVAIDLDGAAADFAIPLIAADLADPAAATDALAEASAANGGLDILVNLAGGAITPIARSQASCVPPDDIDRLFAANFRTTVNCCQAAARWMRSEGGAIVNTASVAGIMVPAGADYVAAYGAAKAAVVQYSRALAWELGPAGIRVNCIAPGATITDRIARRIAAGEIDEAALSTTIPLRRLAKPSDVAGVVEFLVSDLSAYVTGQCLSICGGMVLTPS